MEAEHDGGPIPFTHWAYFRDRAAAGRCKAELDGLYLVGVDLSACDEPGGWLLRAAREVAVDDLLDRHAEVEAVVVRHGGKYDGGESGWISLETLEPLRGSGA